MENPVKAIWSYRFCREWKQTNRPQNRRSQSFGEKDQRIGSSQRHLEKCLGFFRREPKEVDARELFQWIWMYKTKEKVKYSIKTICNVVHVSETGYYKWLRNQSKPYKHEDLLAKILQIRAENPDYGAHRMYLYLQLYDNYTGSYYLILKLYKTHHLTLKKKHHAKGITKTDPATQVSENLIKQDFTAESPNRKWLGDITEIPTAQGKLYVAAVMDCFDGSIVGLKMADNMRSELCVDAFTSGSKKYQAYGMIFHSDRGSQVRQEVA